MKIILSLLVTISTLSLSAMELERRKPKYRSQPQQDTHHLKNKQERDKSNEVALSKIPTIPHAPLTIHQAQTQALAALYLNVTILVQRNH